MRHQSLKTRLKGRVMSRFTIILAAAAAVAGGSATLPTAAIAQAGQGTVTIYGNDPCPRESICIRAPESQRYRIPDTLRQSGTPQQRDSWAKKSQVLTTVGDTGTGSCSAVGPGGHTGCLVQSIKQARTQTRQSAEDNQPPE
jgi:hypothetical protein